MAREKHIKRICNECDQERRTTVHPYEEATYFCNECLIRAGKYAYASNSSARGGKIVLIVAVVFTLLGFILAKLIG